MERLEILQNILPTGLLSESMSSLATALGYKSRATLYRILDGTASTNAVNDFYRRVSDSLFLSEDNLHNMNSAIDNVASLNKLLKSAVIPEKTDAFDVLKAFITHDYSIFTDDFKRDELPGLQRFERTDPNAFFTMLAYFYFKSLRIDFYATEKPYKQRCAEILEPLGEMLMQIYPSNGIAASVVYIYSRTEILNTEAPILWNFITSLAMPLQYYGTPDLGSIVSKEMLLVPFLADRTYFRAKDHSGLLLIRAMKHNVPGSGYYDVFLVETSSGRVESIGAMTFLSDEIFSYRDKLTVNSKLGCWEIDGETLRFGWENEDARPSIFDYNWTRLTLQHSQLLRELNEQISDHQLNEAAMQADGYKSLPEYSVVNVNMSRSGVRLFLINGCSFEISYSTAPFLEYILPSNDVIITEQISTGEIFVSWPQLMHCIPLRLFTQIQSAAGPS